MNIPNSTYVKSELEQVAATTSHMNAKERNQILRLIKDFGDFFGGTIGEWYTDPVGLELNPNYKQFNSKYYPVTIIKT